VINGNKKHAWGNLRKFEILRCLHGFFRGQCTHIINLRI
jgi:hypothetical protein